MKFLSPYILDINLKTNKNEKTGSNMSKITFLDNASEGKNNWWRYLLTIVLSMGGAKTLAIIILPTLIFIIFSSLIIFGIISPNQANSTVSNPLFEFSIVGIIYVILFLLFYLLLRFVHHKKLISLVNTVSKVSWRKILKGAGIWTVIMAVGTLFALISNPSSFELTFNPANFILLLILSLIIFSIQAPYEELFFRGYLMQGISLLTKKPIIPLIITSVFFALLHYGNGENSMMSTILVTHALIFGITMGIIVLGENRLETAMGVHIADNFFPSLIANNPDAGLGNLPSLLTIHGTPNFVIDTITYVLFALILLLIIFWNKKDKLYNIFKTR